MNNLSRKLGGVDFWEFRQPKENLRDAYQRSNLVPSPRTMRHPLNSNVRRVGNRNSAYGTVYEIGPTQLSTRVCKVVPFTTTRNNNRNNNKRWDVDAVHSFLNEVMVGSLKGVATFGNRIHKFAVCWIDPATREVVSVHPRLWRSLYLEYPYNANNNLTRNSAHNILRRLRLQGQPMYGVYIMDNVWRGVECDRRTMIVSGAWDYLKLHRNRGNNSPHPSFYTHMHRTLRSFYQFRPYLIHGDLHGGNILVIYNKVTGVVKRTKIIDYGSTYIIPKRFERAVHRGVLTSPNLATVIQRRSQFLHTHTVNARVAKLTARYSKPCTKANRQSNACKKRSRAFQRDRAIGRHLEQLLFDYKPPNKNGQHAHYSRYFNKRPNVPLRIQSRQRTVGQLMRRNNRVLGNSLRGANTSMSRRTQQSVKNNVGRLPVRGSGRSRGTH